MTTPEPTDARWTVRDAIDFEHLVQVDDPGDREWIASQAYPPDPRDRRVVFRRWLEFVRARTPVALPGIVYARGRRIVQALAIVAGFLVGGALCGSLLTRSDVEPINALLFFGLTVGLQVALAAVVSIAWLLRKAGFRSDLVRDAVFALVKTIGRAMARLDGERRSALQARSAALDFRSAQLAPLIGCDLLIVTQWFAIAFNVGLIGTMLLVYLPLVELRFGWQSTYPFVATQIDAGVRAIASPWSWISGTLAPDAAQIAATRYTRGQRAETLPIAAAVAWWPFLLMSIAVYGLLFRGAVALGAATVLERRLARLPLRHPAANGLWRRIAGPLVKAHASDVVLPAGTSVVDTHRASATDLLIVDDDLATRMDGVRLSAERVFGGPVRRVEHSNIDDDAVPDEILAAVPSNGTVVIATSAARDPIVAIAGFLRTVVTTLPRDSEITLLLVGEPAVSDERRTIWQRFVTIHRLPIGVETAA